MDCLVPLLKICSTLINAVSCFAESSSSNKVQQRVSHNPALIVGFFLCVFFFPMFKNLNWPIATVLDRKDLEKLRALDRCLS